MPCSDLAFTASQSEQTADREKAGKSLILVDPQVELQLANPRDGDSYSANSLVLSPGKCPIKAISQRLVSDPCESLHLVAHGAPGQVALGSGIDRQVLLDHAAAIQQWGVQRIVLWSCNTGQDEPFLALLQQLSNAEVIASAAPLGQGATLGSTGEPALEQAIADLAYSLAAIESIGNTTLTLGEDNRYYAFGHKLGYAWGSDYYPGNWASPSYPGGFQAIGAESIVSSNGWNKVLWQPVGGQSTDVVILAVDGNGKEMFSDQNGTKLGPHFVSSVADRGEYNYLEGAFGLDLDGNGNIGNVLAYNASDALTIESNGNASLSAFNGNYYAFGSKIVDGSGSDLYSGKFAGDAGAPNGWEAIAAETIDGVNHLLLRPVGELSSGDSHWLSHWTIGNGGATSVELDRESNPQGYADLEVAYNIDLDGSGMIGLNQPPVATDGEYALQENQAIALNLANLVTDSNNDVLAFSTASEPANGTVSLDSAGNGTYTPTGFDSLPAGGLGTDSFVYSVTDGKSAAVTNNIYLTIAGANDNATITAHGLESDSLAQNASDIRFSETAIAGGLAVADAFSIADVDYGEQEFQAASVSQTVEIFADGQGAYQGPTAAGRFIGTFALDASAAHNSVAAGATTGTSADLTITDNGSQNGAENGFASLAAGETATASISLSSEDGTATTLSTVTITGVNDNATITALGLESDSLAQNASDIRFSETAIAGGLAVADAFSIADVDYGEQEFQAASVSQTVEIFADGQGAYQGPTAAGRFVGSFAIDASAAHNSVAAGATTGTSADLTITDNGSQNGAENGFASLAAGETATASISLSSEDGTATTLSTVTITGVNDGATITSSPYKTNYAQADFNSTPVITHAGAYQVVDIDYGEQEFSSGNYNTSITVDSTSGRSGQAVGSFSIVSDGSNRSGGSVYRDAGSQNGDSADVVISSDSATQVGQVFDLAAVLDGDPSNSFGIQLNNAINGGKGANGIFDLSDFSVSADGHGQIEVYRYLTNDEGGIIGGGWSATDRNALSATDPLRLIGGINSLAYGETATATLAGASSEDGTSFTAATTIAIVGENDAPVLDANRTLKSFELYGTFTVAEMLGFVDPSKTLITDVDYGSMPESIAVSKLTPAGNFSDADTGTLQRFNESTKEWEDIDTKSVSDANKLLLRPSDLLRFNANAEAYVSAALGGGSNSGGSIFNVEFRAWDSAYAAALESNQPTPDPADISLFSSGLQTINLALATSGERANATDLTYIPGQAIGIDGSNITVAGELTILTPVKGSVAGAGSSVNDNAVALVDGTSFGGIHGVGSANNIVASGNTVINAQAEGLVNVDASNYFDSFDDAVDADATARLGIKSGPVGSGLVANGAFGLRDVDLEVGANLDLTGIVLGQTQATSRSTDGRAHAGSQFSSSAGIANTTADVAGDMALSAEGGILTTVESFSRNGSAMSDSTAAAAYGVVSGLKGSETKFDVGGALTAEVGLNITMATKATMVGDGLDNNNGYSFDDEVVADTKIGKSFGLGTLDSQLGDLAMDVKDTLALDITTTALLDTLATAVSGDATAKGQMAGNTGIYHADLQAGGAGSIDVSIGSRVNSLAETTTGDSFASAYGLHSVGIESSDFDFQDPHSSLAIEVHNDSNARALTKHGSAISHLGSSSAGMLGDAATDLVRSVESVNALVNDHGFSQAAGISGTGAVATADQSALGVSGYAFTTTSALAMDVSSTVDSFAHAAIVQWG